jgi:two-component system sensor histidine kinase FlrB
MEQIVKQHNAQLVVENHVDDMLLLVNQQAVTGALQNLIDNAIQVCEAPAKITLRIDITETIHGMPAILFAVSDNGPGMSDAVIERVFDPFYTTRMKGTGLGLAVVQAVARAHNGTAWVESEEGVGSTFTMYMPVTQQTETLSVQNG